MNKDKILSGVVLATLLMATPLCAANGTWTGSGDGTSWFNSGNWQGGTVPGSSSAATSNDDAFFYPDGTSIPLQADHLAIRRFDIFGNAGAFEFNGNLHLTGSTNGSARGRVYRAPSTTPAGDYSTTFSGTITLQGGPSESIYYFQLYNRTPVANPPTVPTSTMTINSNITGGTSVGVLELNLSSNNNVTGEINGIISDGANSVVALSKGDNGRWILNNANTYSGGTTLNGGQLIVNHNSALGTGKITIQTGSLTKNFDGPISLNNHPLEFNGNFTLINTAGGDDKAFNLGTGDVTLGQSVTIRMQGTPTNGVVIVGGSITDNDGNFGISKTTDLGELHLNGARSYNGKTLVNRGILVLNNGQSGSGDTEVSGATLHLNHAQALGSTGKLLIAGVSTLDNSSGNTITLTTNNEQTWGANITFTGSNDLHLGNGAVSLGANTGATRTITVDASTLTVGGAISNGTHITTPTVNLSKNGTGTLRLNGTNAYTGTTAVSSGRLLVNGQHLTGGAYSVGSTGVLGGSGAIRTSGITFTSGAKLDPGDLNTPGALTLDLGSSTLAIHNLVAADNSQSLLFTLGSVAGSDQIILSNALSTLDIGIGRLEFDDFVFTTTEDFLGGTFVLFETSNTILGTLGANLTGTIGGFDATLGLSQDGRNVIVTMAAIPEPGTWAMLAAGAGLLLGGSRLRRKLR